MMPVLLLHAVQYTSAAHVAFLLVFQLESTLEV
jgi:hypothetical protein